MKTLLFDLDGTLTDPKQGIVACIRHALDELGVELPDGTSLDWCIGPPLRDSFAKLLGPEAAVLTNKAVDSYRRRYSESGIFECTLISGIHSALETLSQSSKLFVATSKPTVYAEKIIEHFKLEGLFKGIYGSELSGERSDKGDLLKFILARESIKVDDTAMIGDREHDAIGATQNGILAYGVAWGYGSIEELNGAGVEHIFHSPSELAPFFRRY